MTIDTITPLPTAPARTDAPATFVTRADAFLAAMVTMGTELNTSIGQMNTDIAGVNADATTASNAATAAAASQAAAEAASNASEWVSGQSYSAGDVVYSPITYLSYRAIQATSGTTDPSTDTANWVGLNVAGGSGEQTFTATGSITAGDLVAIRSDGTVEVVQETVGPGEAGEPTQVTGAGAINGECAMCFDPNEGAYLFMYRSQDNSGYLFGVVGVSTGSSIDWGTPAVIASFSCNYVDAVYNSDTTNICIHLNNGTSATMVTACDLTASTKSFVKGANYNVVLVSTAWNRITYDPDTNKTIQVWTNNSNQNLEYSIGSWSGTTWTYIADGTVFTSSGFSRVPDITYDQSQDKVLVVWADGGDSNKGNAIVGTVGASSVTWGTKAIFDTSDVSDGNLHLEYYPDASKSIVAYRISSAGYANTITISGTTPSFGTKTSTGNRTTQQLAYDSGEGKIIEVYKKTDAPDQNFVKIDVYSVTGTTVVVDSTISLTDEAYVGSNTNDQQGLIYDTDGIYVFGYDDDTNTTVSGIAYDVATVSTNAADWIGIAKEDIAGAASGKIYVTSGISEDQTGLTQGTGYYVTSTGGLSSTATGYPFVGYATDTTDILIGGKNLPSETGQSGKFLTTDGTNLSWADAGVGLTLLNTYTLSSQSTLDIEDFSSTYDDYMFVMTDLITTNNYLHFRLKVSGSYQSSSYNFLVKEYGTNFEQNSSSSYIQPIKYVGSSIAEGTGTGQIIAYIFGANNASTYPAIFGQSRVRISYNEESGTFSGSYFGGVGAIEGLRLIDAAVGGTLTSGTVKVYGIKK